MVKVTCAYCQRVVLVDEETAGKLDETTAFMCDKCKPNHGWNYENILGD